MDAREIENLLSSRGVTNVCPVCGEPWMRGPVGQNFLVSLDESGRPDFFFEAGSPGVRGNRVFVYACGNCGFLRLHSERVLRQFADELRRERGE